jgi:hypothetical protein
VNYLINDYFPYRTDIVLDQLRAKGWYPDVDAPTFSRHGGAVEQGFNLIMTASIAGFYQGDIYYTLDGADPRLPGGAVNAAHATLYTGPVTLTESVRVRARTLFAGMWSAIHDAAFAVGPVAENLGVSEIMYHGDRYGSSR